MTSNPLGQAFKWQLMKLALFIIVLLVSYHMNTANKQGIPISHWGSCCYFPSLGQLE